MASLLGAFQSVRVTLGGDDDSADKLSCRYTVGLLLVFCAVVSTKQYVGDPINCWVPGTYTGAMTTYTNNMCWIKNTYYIEVGQFIPNTDDEVEGMEINYYQWVPIFLCIQALMFHFPNLLWKALSHQSGCHVRHIVKIFSDVNILDPEARKKSILFVTHHIDKFLVTHKRRRHGETRWYHKLLKIAFIGRTQGNYIVMVYLVVKVIYLLNSLGQLFILNGFVGRDYNMYGFEVMQTLISGHVSRESTRFPRSTLCSFKVREFGNNVHRHTVQCVLTINLFNEKIYAIFWFWLIFVITMTILSVFPWVFNLMAKRRMEFCRNCLKQTERYTNNMPTRQVLTPFVNSYLRQDGVFILKLIGKNVNGVVLCEVMESLFNLYQEKVKKAAEEDGEKEMIKIDTDMI